ncbi:MAG TPA: 16S rRNA (uracil(1498)-N(3))-methyltransferase [Casimicrobiaceae bacterium]|jgi:16S rRNA (uracil1498-N3)-methyltransferase
MNSPRFYCATPLSDTGERAEIELSRATARHIAQALRMRVGDAVALFNGEGGEFAATITRIDRRGVAAQIGAFDPIERETSHPTTLVQSIIAADMMDLVVRKAVELGVAAIVPVFAEYSQRTPETRTAKRVERWGQIAIAACEQCGRNRVPAIADAVPLSAWLDLGGKGPGVVVLGPDAPTTYAEVLRKSAPRFIVVGPEGGFTRQEIDHAVRNGARLARLGRTILRAETAALAALAAIVACDDTAWTT